MHLFKKLWALDDQAQISVEKLEHHIDLCEAVAVFWYQDVLQQDDVRMLLEVAKDVNFPQGSNGINPAKVNMNGKNQSRPFYSCPTCRGKGRGCVSQQLSLHWVPQLLPPLQPHYTSYTVIVQIQPALTSP